MATIGASPALACSSMLGVDGCPTALREYGLSWLRRWLLEMALCQEYRDSPLTRLQQISMAT
jgi:hypothetical protein